MTITKASPHERSPTRRITLGEWQLRRDKVVEATIDLVRLWFENELGTQAELARELGVNRSTISRHRKALVLAGDLNEDESNQGQRTDLRSCRTQLPVENVSVKVLPSEETTTPKDHVEVVTIDGFFASPGDDEESATEIQTLPTYHPELRDHDKVIPSTFKPGPDDPRLDSEAGRAAYSDSVQALSYVINRLHSVHRKGDISKEHWRQIGVYCRDIERMVCLETGNQSGTE